MILELGVPFSDPMSEGPVIQKGHERALANGMSLHRVLSTVAEFRKDNDRTPIVMMGYANPIEDFANGFFSEEEGTTAQGLVAYFNVDPGRVAITVEGHSCTPLLSGVNNAAGATTVTIEAGRVSYMGILCEAN